MSGKSINCTFMCSLRTEHLMKLLEMPSSLFNLLWVDDKYTILIIVSGTGGNMYEMIEQPRIGNFFSSLPALLREEIA